MAIIEIGQKKIIDGKIYRKCEQEDGCEGCAFQQYNRDVGCWNGRVGVDVSREEGGAECFRSIWVEVTPEEQAYEERTCVDAVKPVNAVLKTVTLEVVRADPKDNECFYCVFGDLNYATCPFPDEGKCIGCASGSYFRVKAGA